MIFVTNNILLPPSRDVTNLFHVICEDCCLFSNHSIFYTVVFRFRTLLLRFLLFFYCMWFSDWTPTNMFGILYLCWNTNATIYSVVVPCNARAHQTAWRKEKKRKKGRKVYAKVIWDTFLLLATKTNAMLRFTFQTFSSISTNTNIYRRMNDKFLIENTFFL